MKEAKVTRLSRYHNRANKLKKAAIKPKTILDSNQVDIAVIDLVLKALYYNSHIDAMDVEKDIYKRANVQVPYEEAERLWEVMINTGLVNPVAGFGNAGKLKLSRTGYQLMAQYGGYAEYMEAMKNSNNNQPQIIIETPGGEDDEDNNCKEVTDKTKGE